MAIYLQVLKYVTAMVIPYKSHSVTERCICVSLIEKALNGFSSVSFLFFYYTFICETKFVQLNILFVMIINLTRWSSNLSSSYSKFSSRDHLRSRIICGPSWGSIDARVHLRYCTDLVVRDLLITEIIIELGYSYAVIHLADFRWRT